MVEIIHKDTVYDMCVCVSRTQHNPHGGIRAHFQQPNDDEALLSRGKIAIN